MAVAEVLHHIRQHLQGPHRACLMSSARVSAAEDLPALYCCMQKHLLLFERAITSPEDVAPSSDSEQLEVLLTAAGPENLLQAFESTHSLERPPRPPAHLPDLFEMPLHSVNCAGRRIVVIRGHGLVQVSIWAIWATAVHTVTAIAVALTVAGPVGLGCPILRGCIRPRFSIDHLAMAV